MTTPFDLRRPNPLTWNCYKPATTMDTFKRVIDSISRIQMDYICQQYDGFYQFAKLMEKLAHGIADGIIDVPKDH